MRAWVFVQFYNYVIRHALNRHCKQLWVEAGSPGVFLPAEHLDREGVRAVRELLA